MTFRGRVAAVRACRAALLIGGAALALPAAAQPFDFEPPVFTGSAPGVNLAGQNGWTAPGVSEHFKVHTYTGNALGFVANPSGGEQFSAARAGNGIARGQRNVS